MVFIGEAFVGFHVKRMKTPLQRHTLDGWRQAVVMSAPSKKKRMKLPGIVISVEVLDRKGSRAYRGGIGMEEQ